MNSTQPTSRRLTNNGLLLYLFLLTGFFILAEISLLIQGNSIYFGEYKFILGHINIPHVFLPALYYFIFVQLMLHVMFTLVIWLEVCLIGSLFHLSSERMNNMGVILWVLSIVTILLANQYFFPNSKFSNISSAIISARVNFILLIACSIAVGMIFLVTIWSFIVKVPIIAIIISLIIMILAGYQLFPQKINDASTPLKPNVILIGIDSLRPDFLGYFGFEKITPHMDDFLNQATVFSDAFTTLARTFPAWISILTGQYPKKSGVRFNLPPTLQLNLKNTLPYILHQHGYETIFATDETRFSNIDQRFGFDKVVTPPIGFNDFFLGSLNDFPLANLVVNTPIGKYLFPHSYGNRPVSITYDPNSFINFLEPTLSKSRHKPLFFAVHFCLPHYPYFWKAVSADDSSVRNYQAAVQRVDQQFQDFYTLLKKNNLLEHSIIVLLSDHGEAMELPGDRVTESDLFVSDKDKIKKFVPHFYPSSLDNEDINKSYGHGTDVLGLTQYHIVLAFQTRGLEKNQAIIHPENVSLLDIKPTILNFLNVTSQNNDGVSLKNIILGNKMAINMNRHVFIESDFSPQAIRTVHPEVSKVLLEGINFYQLNSVTGRITIKNSMIKDIILSKQYADIYQDWILALYPQNHAPMIPILVNLTTGDWTNDLHSKFAKLSPANKMLLALKDFYQDDIRLPSTY